MIFVDTNYFLRFLIDDGTNQHKKVVDLFLDAARSKTILTTSTLVIFEVFWVLGSHYGFTKGKKIECIQLILKMAFIQLNERLTLSEALNIHEKSSLEFEDCYNIVYFKKNRIQEFATFDKKIIKFLAK